MRYYWDIDRPPLLLGKGHVITVHRLATASNVTLHHEMSRNVPDGHFHVLIFAESKFYAIYNGENHFQIRGLVVELQAFECGGTTFGTFEKNLL